MLTKATVNSIQVPLLQRAPSRKSVPFTASPEKSPPSKTSDKTNGYSFWAIAGTVLVSDILLAPVLNPITNSFLKKHNQFMENQVSKVIFKEAKNLEKASPKVTLVAMAIDLALIGASCFGGYKLYQHLTHKPSPQSSQPDPSSVSMEENPYDKVFNA